MLLDKHNPDISQVQEKSFYGDDEIVNLTLKKFRFAFSIESFLKGSRRDDPHYVKYLVRAHGKKDGLDFETILPHYECTEKDWE